MLFQSDRMFIVIFMHVFCVHCTANVISNDKPLSSSYRRLSGPTTSSSSPLSASASITSPTFRRNKLVRASFKMLGSRWKPSSMSCNGGDKKNNSQTKKEPTPETDSISDRFGKEYNLNVEKSVNDVPPAKALQPPLTQPIKNKTNFFYAFATKENVDTTKITATQFPSDIPVNVAPKAAALLQIPICSTQNFKLIEKPMRMNPTVCNMIANSKQFKMLKTLTQSNDNDVDNSHSTETAYTEYDPFTPTTIRRTPYRTNHFMHSKIFLNTTLVIIF